MSRCNLCGEDAAEPLIEFGAHPIAHRFLSTPDEPEYTHPLTLGVCRACGLSQLIDPIPAHELYTNYNWLSSWKPNPHVPKLVAAIEALPGLSTESRVLEVGSNDGSFLAELRERGFSRLLGLEPADDACAAAAERGIETIHGYFTPEAAQAIVDDFGQADLFVARHVLEHVQDLATFAAAMRIVLRAGGHVLVEVPDFDFSQAAPDYSAMWEEHVNHFTRRSMERFLQTAGVEAVSAESFLFSGQALAVFGRRSVETDAPEPAGDGAQADAYRERWPRFRAAIAEYLAARRANGARIGVYGAGGRAATLINVCDLGGHVSVVLDDQPEKQGRFMPGSRLPVVPGDTLARGELDLCLLAVNAENEEAVIARHGDFVAAGGEFASLHPPSPRLPAFWKDV